MHTIHTSIHMCNAIHIYIYMYVCLSIFLFIYVERVRERDITNNATPEHAFQQMPDIFALPQPINGKAFSCAASAGTDLPKGKARSAALSIATLTLGLQIGPMCLFL